MEEHLWNSLQASEEWPDLRQADTSRPGGREKEEEEGIPGSREAALHCSLGKGKKAWREGLILKQEGTTAPWETCPQAVCLPAACEGGRREGRRA